MITRFGDRYAVAKFSKSGLSDKVPEGSALIFGDNRISFQHSTQCRMGGRKLTCQKKLDSFSRFDGTPTCDRQTDTGPWLVPRDAMHRAVKM